LQRGFLSICSVSEIGILLIGLLFNFGRLCNSSFVFVIGRSRIWELGRPSSGNEDVGSADVSPGGERHMGFVGPESGFEV
jgi:hypothetical protein